MVLLSKADKMFEDLGFEKEEMPEIKRIEYRVKFEDLEEGSIGIADVVIFELDEKTVAFCEETKYGEYLPIGIDARVLQAINEKAKELGWI